MDNLRPKTSREVCKLCLSTIKTAVYNIKTGKEDVGIAHLEKLVKIITQWHSDIDVECKQYNGGGDGNKTRDQDN